MTPDRPVADQRRAGSGPGSAEAGSGSIWMITIVAVVVTATTTALAVGSAVVARHRADGAADLAALAGAELLVRGDPQPCATAARVAEDSGARLDSCQVAAGTVLVVAAVEPGWSAWGLDMPPARASARAGPQ